MVSLLVLVFDSSFLQKWGVATSISNRGTPSSPQPTESEEAELGWGRGAGALVTLAGESEALAWRESLGPRGNTKAQRHMGKARFVECVSADAPLSGGKAPDLSALHGLCPVAAAHCVWLLHLRQPLSPLPHRMFWARQQGTLPMMSSSLLTARPQPPLLGKFPEWVSSPRCSATDSKLFSGRTQIPRPLLRNG